MTEKMFVVVLTAVLFSASASASSPISERSFGKLNLVFFVIDKQLPRNINL